MDKSKLVYQLWLAWGGDDGDPEELKALIRLVTDVRQRALANGATEREQMIKRIGIAERMARYLGWAFEQSLYRPNETTELLSQVLREWREASPKTCPRCGGELDNVSPGISLIAGGIAICTPCLNPGETEIARARGV